MAWHILHSLLDQVRIHSTFPGKLWIVMMFIFRIVVVARIGDNVYHDEQTNFEDNLLIAQSSFICNTLTPGCTNVCFNRFSPISQLRYWSLMVLAVSAPGILFCIYASHKISHAFAKFPLDDEEEESPPPYNPPGLKRKRTDATPFNNPSAPPLYVVKRFSSKKDEKSDRGNEKRSKDKNFNPPKYANEDKELLDKRRGSLTDNIFTSVDDVQPRRWKRAEHQPRNGFPVYDRRGRQIDYVQDSPKKAENMKAKKETKEMLKNPQMYRAYWWHVFIRTALEVGFLVGQYFLYGFYVPELFECTRWPCPKTVDCFVSRPMEKTCLMYLMFGLGAISCALSLGEFWTLGWERFKYALCCRGHKMTYQEKRRLLAELAKAEHKHHHGDNPRVYQKPTKDEILLLQHGKFTSKLSLESLSSETTVESV